MHSRPRGRPREYDREEALGCALDLFAEKGFDATSLDDLARVMDMNRPSIYNAFGDKESIYLGALDLFTDRMRQSIGEFLVAEPDLKKALTNAYLGALDVYFFDDPPRGCFVFCTAPVEALTHAPIQKHMNELLDELDSVFELKFRQAQEAGEYPLELDAKLAARVAHGVLHSLAIRARAGESKASLRSMAKFAVSQLCRDN
jgi:AcrR family transcriptional regulator